jgi:hypothetical protein
MTRPQQIHLKVCNTTIGEETYVSIEDNAIQNYKKVKMGYVFEVGKFGRMLTITTGNTIYEIEIKRVHRPSETTWRKILRILGL